MATYKEITIHDKDGSMNYFPRTEASLVIDAEAKKTVKEQIDSLENVLYDVESKELVYLEQGSINGITGELSDKQTRVRTKGYLKCDKEQIVINVSSSTLTYPAIAQISYFDAESKEPIEIDGASYIIPKTNVSTLRLNVIKDCLVKVVLKNGEDSNANASPNDFIFDLTVCDGMSLTEGAGIKEIISRNPKEFALKQDLGDVLCSSPETLHDGRIGISQGYTTNTDPNWVHTDFIKLPVKSFRINLFSNKDNIPVVSFYTEKTPESVIAEYTIIQSMMDSNVIVPDEAKYVRFCGASINYTTAIPEGYTPMVITERYKVDELKNEIEAINKKDVFECIFPKNIYLVCNDSVPNSAYNRNYSPAIYADHFFKDINSERNIKFSDGGVKQSFTFEAEANSSWDATLNGGNDINIVTKSFKMVGEIKDTDFDVNIISTKATPSRNVTPRVLVIGSSTVYGEGSSFLSNGMMNLHPYHAICKWYFMKDADEQGGGNECILLGTQCHESLSIGGKTIKDNFEGYRGYKINQLLGAAASGNLQTFLDSAGDFSFVNGWLKKYRTMDDSGNRLPWVSAGASVIGADGKTYNIGTLVTSESLLKKYNVCTPTHIVYHAGANGGATSEQIHTLVNSAKRDFPNVKVALVMNDSMGTIFPSAYKDADYRKCRWNVLASNDNRHLSLFEIQKIYEEFETEDYKHDGVYVLPFFFVSNPMYFACRGNNHPEYEIDTENGKHEINWGWLPATHADARVHYAYAYQLYAWLKYTMTVNS